VVIIVVESVQNKKKMKLTEHVIYQRSKIRDFRDIQFLDLSGCRLVEIDFIQFLPNVEVLCLSSNRINSLKAFEKFQNSTSYTHHGSKLKELYLRNNAINDAYDVSYLQHLSSSLRVLFLTGNPCTNSLLYQITIKRYLPYLRILDDHVIDMEKHEVLRPLCGKEALPVVEPLRKPPPPIDRRIGGVPRAEAAAIQDKVTLKNVDLPLSILMTDFNHMI
jgi:hypothetical protein